MSSSSPKSGGGNPYGHFIPREELQGFASWQPGSFGGTAAAGVSAAEAPEHPVVTTGVTVSDVEERIAATGELQAKDEAAVAAEVPGQVTAVLVEEGQPVEAGQVVLEMRSGLFRIWTFPLFRAGQEVARIEKKWGGVLREAFTDADTFLTTFTPAVRGVERALILAAAVFVDLQYFEKKAD